MSNESSASETTPLRRPESRLSEDELTSSNLETFNNFPNSLINRANTKITIPSNNLTRFPLTNNNNNSQSEIVTMDSTNKRIFLRISVDLLVLLVVGFAILVFFLAGKPYERGFFCDDESLKHPFKDSTVKNWMLYIIGLVIPIVTITLVEVLRSLNQTKKSNGNNIKRRYVLFDYEIPDWLVECYKKIGVFGFGAAASQVVTDIAKYSIGRLRPHFFSVCQPIMPDGSTCDDSQNFGKYIVDFKCRGVGSSERMLKEMRLSFPSGHSSFTFYTMVYLALYLQARWHWNGSKLLRHALQFGLILIAWYTALSRVSDYKHHWSDVLAGSAIGALVAVIVANYVSDLFVEKHEKPYVLPSTNQDINTSNGR